MQALIKTSLHLWFFNKSLHVLHLLYPVADAFSTILAFYLGKKVWLLCEESHPKQEPEWKVTHLTFTPSEVDGWSQPNVMSSSLKTKDRKRHMMHVTLYLKFHNFILEIDRLWHFQPQTNIGSCAKFLAVSLSRLNSCSLRKWYFHFLCQFQICIHLFKWPTCAITLHKPFEQGINLGMPKENLEDKMVLKWKPAPLHNFLF